MGVDLPLVWAVIILAGIMMYVVMDGFDLGIGILFPLVADDEDRDVMMNSVAPVWDGNETWLVLGGAGLLAAFPLAYSVILSAFYLPLILMLIGLIFRGVAFEFRFKSTVEGRHWWDKAFTGGSVVAAFFQGMTLGAFVQGVPVQGGHYAGGPFDWITPFSVFTGLGLVVAYALLGCTWLVMKCEDQLQARMRHLGNLFWFLPVPILVLACTGGLFWALRRDTHYAPFLLTLALIFLSYSGLGISLWPNVIPPSVSIWDAAGPAQSLGFTLVGTLFIVPFVLMYTAFAYWVFRGKVRRGEGYH